MQRKIPRNYLTLGFVAIIIVSLVYSFWPRAVMVDIGEISTQSLIVTIDEDAKTRVRDAYIVSAPVTGRLLRVEVEPGDTVTGSSVVARMRPSNPAALDARTREQARAASNAASAALKLAEADQRKAKADLDFAKLELNRVQKLRDSDVVSETALDRAKSVWRAAKAALDTANAAITMRRADLTNAEALLKSFSSGKAPAPLADDGEILSLYAPVTGRILHVLQESEGIISAGTPIIEIGDTANELEICAELLSTDAVKVEAGDRVIVENWGGTYPLNGIVERVEPIGFTKYSALGVEEQRVKVIIQFTDPAEKRALLGHGFRVEARIVTWEDDAALAVPSNALFRDGENWAVFAVDKGRAKKRIVSVGQNNGAYAQILEGVVENEKIILYPSSTVTDGMRVTQRVTG